MEAFRKVRASKRRERNLHICWKEMHTHRGEIELKEEEEFKQCKKALEK
jgi:hypothetical protein